MKNSINFELKENELLIKENYNVFSKIKDIDIYVFSNLIKDISDNPNSIQLNYYRFSNVNFITKVTINKLIGIQPSYFFIKFCKEIIEINN